MARIEGVFMLAHTVDKAKESIIGWLASEKLDGMRAMWDGKTLITSGGNKIVAPDWWIARLPPGIALDGEVWMGRGLFPELSGVVRRQTVKDPDAWKRIKFLVFDAPDSPGGFEERLECARRAIDAHEPMPTCEVTTQTVVESMEHLKKMLEAIEAVDGEGLMLRKPGSEYERKRSYNLLKVKTFLDSEAQVVGYKPGKGKHAGRLGALKLEWNVPGTQLVVEFDVGTGFTDQERDEALYPIGTLVTFGYFELSKDSIPRFPTFIRIRPEE